MKTFFEKVSKQLFIDWGGGHIFAPDVDYKLFCGKFIEIQLAFPQSSYDAYCEFKQVIEDMKEVIDFSMIRKLATSKIEKQDEENFYNDIRSGKTASYVATALGMDLSDKEDLDGMAKRLKDLLTSTKKCCSEMVESWDNMLRLLEIMEGKFKSQYPIGITKTLTKYDA